MTSLALQPENPPQQFDASIGRIVSLILPSGSITW